MGLNFMANRNMEKEAERDAKERRISGKKAGKCGRKDEKKGGTACKHAGKCRQRRVPVESCKKGASCNLSKGAMCRWVRQTK